MKISLSERLVYWSYCILTFGVAWVMKIIIKLAILEALMNLASVTMTEKKS